MTFFAMSQMGLAYSTLRNVLAFLTLSQLCLVYPVRKILENWKEKHNLKDKTFWS